MNNEDSLPDYFRGRFLAAISKPVSERNAEDLSCIELGEAWFALHREANEEAGRATEEFERKILAVQIAVESNVAEIVAEAKRILTEWEAVARAELAEVGLGGEGKNIDELIVYIASQDALEIPAGRLLGAIWEAHQASKRHNPEIGFMAGLGMASALIAMGRSKLLEEALSVLQSKRSKGVSRRPRYPTKRVIRCALAERCKTTSEVEIYLETNQEVRDQWGLMAVTDEGDWFTVEDLDGPKNEHGEYPEGKVYKDRLPVLVSQVKSEK